VKFRHRKIAQFHTSLSPVFGFLIGFGGNWGNPVIIEVGIEGDNEHPRLWPVALSLGKIWGQPLHIMGTKTAALIPEQLRGLPHIINNEHFAHILCQWPWLWAQRMASRAGDGRD
jgi:hypothetical protein